MRRYTFTSESVTEGHPDKVCDKISDAILDAILAADPRARVACETMVKTGYAVIAGEITTNAKIDYTATARRAITDIGYTDSAIGFDGNTCAILTAVEAQSPDISQGVSEGQGLHKEQGAGDQGLMFGFATDETPELMPAPISYAHQMAKRLTEVRKQKKVDWLRPDGKTQVTMEYEGDKPSRCQALVLSTQHHEKVKHKEIVDAMRALVIEKVIPAKFIDKNTKIHVNPTGRFVIGGPNGDAGLTGRKIIVDTYGGMGRHGGGAFSGKDPSKVDRSACYYARYVAKNVVAAKLAAKCEVQIAYAIGVAQPVGVFVNTFGTGRIADDVLERYILSNFDMRPKALIDELDLLRPIYYQTAAYGHFGRTAGKGGEFSWESTARAAKMADDLSKPSATMVNGSNGKANGKSHAPPSAKKADKKAPKKSAKKGKQDSLSA